MSRYPELAAKVDAFFARVMERHGDQMVCSSGCSDCCHVRLSVTGIEAQALLDEVATWDADRKAALAANIAAAAPDRCTALAPNGRCLVYAGRPLVCRSHGAPMKAPTYKSLKVYNTCNYNFARDFHVRNVDPDCVLDQETISTILLALNKAEGFTDDRHAIGDILLAALDDTATDG
jgi:hypothetical protein